MHDLPLRLIRRGEIRKMREPFMADRRPQDLPYGHDFIVNGRAGALPVGEVVILCTRYSWTLPGVMLERPMSPKNGRTWSRITANPSRASMALGDDLIFFLKLLGRLAEGLFIFLEEARLGFPAQGKIPVFRILLGEVEVVLASGDAVLAALDGRSSANGARAGRLDQTT